MRDLNEAQVFVEVACRRSFVAAAKALQMTPSTVTRRISSLEARLGTLLIERNPRHVSLTEAGAAYLPLAQQSIAILAQAEEAVQKITGEPQGVLRLSAPTEMIRHIIGDVIVEYMYKYPKVCVEAIGTDWGTDLLDESIHLLIQAHSPRESITSRVIQRTLGMIEMVLCASPDYIAQHGAPQTPDDLLTRPCLVLGPNIQAAQICLNSKTDKRIFVVPVRMFTTNVGLCQKAALSSLGPAGLPIINCRRALAEGRLIKLLPGWDLEVAQCTARYRGDRHPPLRVRVFIDLLVQRLAEVTPWDASTEQAILNPK